MSREYQHFINIIAKDAATAVFKNIGASANQSAQQIKNAGGAATASLNQVDAAAKKADGSFAKLGGTTKTFNQQGAAFGALAATITGVMADAARAAAEEAAQLQILEQAVVNTGASFDTLSGQMDGAVESAKALSFADDEAVVALTELTTITGDAEQSLDLMGVAMDLARGKGISLASAATIVGRVAAGNTGILTRYGIVIDENATSTEALAAIQERYAGQAQTFADTQIGAAQRFTNALQDQIENIAANTGALQGLLLVMPGLTSAFQIGAAAIGGFSGVAARAVPAVLALTASMGPLALLLAGGAALGFLAIKIKESADASAEAKDPVDSLTESIALLGATADETTVSLFTEEIVTGLRDVTAAAEAANAELATVSLEVVQKSGQQGGLIDEMTFALLQGEINLLQARQEELGKTAISVTDLNQIESDLNAILASGSEEMASHLKTLDAAIDGYNAGTTAGYELSAAFTAVRDEAENGTRSLAGATSANYDYALSADEAAEKAAKVAASVRESIDAIVAQQEAVKRFEEFRLASDRLPTGSALPGASAAQERADRERLDQEAEQRAQEEYRRRQQEVADEQRVRDELQSILERRAAEEERYAEERARLIEGITDAEREGAQEVAQINRDRIAEQRDLEQGYAQEVRGLQQQRVADERETAQALRGIDAERAAAAADAERQLADLAAERQTIARDLAAEAAAAEKEWRETSAENLRAQAELRDELRTSTAEAARAWQELNADNLAAQRDIREELARTLREQQIAFDRTRQDLGRDLAQARQDLANAQDPEFYDATAVANATNAIEEIRLSQRRAREDNKREEAEARREARDDLRGLEDDRLRAEQEYHEQVRELQSGTADQLRDLEAQRREAQQDFQAQQRDASAEAAQQLQDLAQQEEQILSERARRFAELERERQTTLRDSAREQQTIAREMQQAQEQLAQGSARVGSIAARETQAAMRGAQTDIDILRQELEALAEETYTVNVRVRERRRDGDTAEEQARQDQRDPEPLDKYLGGPIPHYAMGGTRPYVVGEYGPELRVGNLIVPTGAAQSRDDYPGATVQNTFVFPNARFELKTPDLGREVASYVNQQRRR